MFAVAVHPDSSLAARNAAIAQTSASQEQFAAQLRRSLMSVSLHFRLSAKALRTLLPTHFSPCPLFSAPCALFRALFCKLSFCFQRLAHSSRRSFACVQMLSSVLSRGCALFE